GARALHRRRGADVGRRPPARALPAAGRRSDGRRRALQQPGGAGPGQRDDRALPFDVVAAPDARELGRIQGDNMGSVSSSDGVGLHYEEAGRGRPILLIGGWRSSTPWWQRQLPELAEIHRVIAMDPRSYGQSEKAAHGHRMGRYARDVYDLVDALDLHDVTA